MKEQIEEMRNFMFEKSNSANVEPVFTTNDGKEIVLGKELKKLLNDVLEQAFIPFLAEALYNAGYLKQSEIADDIIAIIEQRMARNIERLNGCQSDIWKVGYLAENEAYQDIKEIIEQRMKGGAE